MELVTGVTLTSGGGLDHDEILWSLALPIGPGCGNAGLTHACQETWLYRLAIRGARNRGRRSRLRWGERWWKEPVRRARGR